MFDDQGKNAEGGASGHAGARHRLERHARQRRRLPGRSRMPGRPRNSPRRSSTAHQEGCHDRAAAPKEVSVEQLFANIAATQAKALKVHRQDGRLRLLEAVRTILEGIKSTKVQLEIVSIDVGLVTKNDVLMASAAGAVIIGFHTRLENGVTPLAQASQACASRPTKSSTRWATRSAR
jgi:hypothetical protein